MQRELITVQQIDPAELSSGEFAAVVRRAAEGKDRYGVPAKLIIVDSLNGYLSAMPEEKLLTAQLHELLASEHPDLLISDVGMPVEDGYHLIRRVRALRDDRGATPAIALTAYARVENRMKAIAAGYQMHLAKPVEPAELITMVSSWKRGPAPASA